MDSASATLGRQQPQNWKTLASIPRLINVEGRYVPYCPGNLLGENIIRDHDTEGLTSRIFHVKLHSR